MKPECYDLLKSLKWDNSRVRNGIPNSWINTWRDETNNDKVSHNILALVNKVLKIKKI